MRRKSQIRSRALVSMTGAALLWITCAAPQLRAQTGSATPARKQDAAGKTTPAGKAKSKSKSRAKPSKAAAEAMRKAAAVRASAKGKKGAARTAILREAAAAYAKVAADFAAEPVAVAPASFAEAEIRRATGDLAKARGLYQKAVDLDGARFAERGLLQLAHIARRTKDLAGAMQIYGKVATLKPGSGRAHEARMWVARCHVAAGKLDAATAAYRSGIDKAGTPRRVIDACNRLANLLVKSGKLDDAETVIARAAAAAKGEGSKTDLTPRLAKNLQKAYDRMSSRRALQRARDKANRSHEDAQDVERHR